MPAPDHMGHHLLNGTWPVPPERWGVSVVDLQDFREVVRREVACGRILPTEWDEFDAADTKIGPSIRTVCDQLIKPVTARDGNFSWALRRNPDGLDCDIFITHCWAEGVYEFIDKVLLAWPRRARGGAYCCMLSNPQNVDISSFLTTPRASPFALALHRARYVIAVPNSRCSIYTRVWCVYEAYLAYSWNKLFFTARPPVDNFVLHMASLVLLWIVGACFTICFLNADVWNDFDAEFVVFIYSFSSIYVFWTLGLFAIFSSNWRVVRLLNLVCVFLAGQLAGQVMWAEAVHGRSRHPSYFLGRLCCSSCIGLPLMAAREADRLWAIASANSSKQLRKGYTGMLQDACSSVQKDKDEILAEIRHQCTDRDVEHTIEVLIAAHMSTPSLRSTSRRGVDVECAGDWSLAHVVLMLTVLVITPPFDIMAGAFGSSCSGTIAWVPWIQVVLGLIWALLFVLMEKDQRGLATGVANFAALGAGCTFFLHFLVALLVFLLSPPTGPYKPPNNCVVDAVNGFVFVVPMVALSVAGMSTLVRIPVIGPQLVSFFLSSAPSCRQGQDGGGTDDDGSGSEGGEQQSFASHSEDIEEAAMQRESTNDNSTDSDEDGEKNR